MKRPPRTGIAVRLTPRQLSAIVTVLEGYTVNRCNSDHPHPGYACDGWSPAEARSLDTAAERLWRACFSPEAQR